jgi:hypothetical protein
MTPAERARRRADRIAILREVQDQAARAAGAGAPRDAIRLGRVPCPFCGGTRSRVRKTVRRRDGTDRHRVCATCGGEFVTLAPLALERLLRVRRRGRPVS